MLNEFEAAVLTLSLQVSAVALAFSMPFAIVMGWLLARRDFLGKAVVDSVLMLPLILPPVTVGYGLLLLFGRQGPLGSLLMDTFGISFAFNWKGAALAAGLMGFPLLVRAVRIGFETQDRGLEEAARTLGATRYATFLTISLPQAWPAILSGCILAFARSLGEFGATITFVSNIPGETQTLPLALYTLLQTPDGEAGALRLMLLSLLIALAAMIFSEILTRRHLRRIRGEA